MRTSIAASSPVSALVAIAQAPLAPITRLPPTATAIADQTIHGAPLHATSDATTVRVRHGETLVTDGPFAETTEQLGGFILIEARDLNDAIQVAAKIPMGRRGTIEVRPIKELM